MAKVSVISRHPSHHNFDFPEFDKKVRIRFGSQKTYSAKKDIDFPSPSSIAKTSNKMKMKKLLIEAGVLTPKWEEFNFDEMRKLVEAHNASTSLFIVEPKFKSIIFKEKNHSRGEGILFIDNMEDLETVINNGKEGYIEEVINNHREFRVHVCGGNAFYVDEKIPREDGHTARIKNLANGYKYRNKSVSRPYPITIKKESIKAVEALGMEFGAVDVSISESGDVNVFEVNSAMGLRTKTRELYQEQLIALIIKKGANII